MLYDRWLAIAIIQQLANNTTQMKRSHDNTMEHPTLSKRMNMIASSSSSPPSSLTPQNIRRVQFSDMSSLHLYPQDPIYTKNKSSFTKSDRMAMQEQAIIDANRIRRVLRQSDANEAKDTSSLKHALRINGIADEEIIGIEHLVFSDPRRIAKRKKNHQMVVLMEQEIQRQSTLKQHNDKDSSDKLAQDMRIAQLSKILTKRPASAAKRRATMAAAMAA